MRCIWNENKHNELEGNVCGNRDKSESKFEFVLSSTINFQGEATHTLSLPTQKRNFPRQNKILAFNAMFIGGETRYRLINYKL